MTLWQMLIKWKFRASNVFRTRTFRSWTLYTCIARRIFRFRIIIMIIWRYACALDIILRLIFATFCFVNFSIFRPQILWKYIDSRSRESAYNLYQSFWNFVDIFSMVWRCACGLNIIFQILRKCIGGVARVERCGCMKVWMGWVLVRVDRVGME